MALPDSGKLTLRDILTEYNAPVGTRLSELVRGGLYVPDHNKNKDIPTSPPISIRDFYGSQLAQPGFTVPYVADSMSPWFQPVVERFQVDPPTTNAPYATAPASERVVFDITVRCGDLTLGSNRGPLLPGYSYHRERLKMFFGLYNGDPDAAFVTNSFNGLYLDLHATDNARGYAVAILGRGVPSAAQAQFAFKATDMIQYAFQGRRATEYSACMPTESRTLRIKVSRGYDGTVPYFSGGTQKYSPVWKVEMFKDALGQPADKLEFSTLLSGWDIKVGPSNGTLATATQQAILAQGYPCLGVSVYNSGRSDAVVEKYEITQ